MFFSEQLQSQIDSLSNTILNFRRKQILSQNQTQKLINEKAELECCLKEQEHKMSLIQLQMRNDANENENKTECVNNETVEFNYKKMAFEIAEKDPNRPRYTLKELHEVLIEKNQLKVWLHETQEELHIFKKKFILKNHFNRSLQN